MRIRIDGPRNVRDLVKQLAKVGKNVRIVESIGIVSRKRPRRLTNIKIFEKVEPKCDWQVVFTCHCKMQ